MALLLDKSIKELFVEAPPLLILPVFYFDKYLPKKACFLQRAYYTHYPTMKLLHQWYSFNISCFKLKIVKRIGLLGMASIYIYIKICPQSFILIIAITFKISFKKKEKKMHWRSITHVYRYKFWLHSQPKSQHCMNEAKQNCIIIYHT